MHSVVLFGLVSISLVSSADEYLWTNSSEGWSCLAEGYRSGGESHALDSGFTNLFWCSWQRYHDRDMTATSECGCLVITIEGTGHYAFQDSNGVKRYVKWDGDEGAGAAVSDNGEHNLRASTSYMEGEDHGYWFYARSNNLCTTINKRELKKVLKILSSPWKYVNHECCMEMNGNENWYIEMRYSTLVLGREAKVDCDHDGDYILKWTSQSADVNLIDFNPDFNSKDIKDPGFGSFTGLNFGLTALILILSGLVVFELYRCVKRCKERKKNYKESIFYT